MNTIKTKTPMLLSVAAFSLGFCGALFAEAGILPVLIKPKRVQFRKKWTKRAIARMRERPKYIRRKGATFVKYSFGQFKLLDRSEMKWKRRGAGSGSGSYSMPSDAYHANVNPTNLKWSMFRNAHSLMTPVKDQGRRGSCHVMAATALVESLWKQWTMFYGRPYYVLGQLHRHAEDLDLSEQWLMYAAKKRAYAATNGRTGDGGDPNYDLKTVELLHGHIPEVCWPYNPIHWSSPPHNAQADANKLYNWKDIAQTTSGNAPSSVVHHLAQRSTYNFIKSFNIIHDSQHVLNGNAGINFIRDQIINIGRPVIVCVPWPTHRMISNGCVIYVPDAVKDKSAKWCWDDKDANKHSKWFRGGHAILVCGVGKAGTPAAGLYKFKNSWTRWWGDHGYGYFTEAFLKKFLGCTSSCRIKD